MRMRILGVGCGLLGLLILGGCGGPDPAKNPKFNEASLKDPTAVKIPDEIKSMGVGKPAGAPNPGVTK